MSTLYTVTGISAVVGIEGIASMEGGTLGGCIPISPVTIYKNRDVFSEGITRIRAEYGRFGERGMVLYPENQPWDREGIVLFEGGNLTCTAFNNEVLEGGKEVTRIYHRFPLCPDAAETDIQRQNYIEEARNQGFDVLIQTPLKTVVRFRLKESSVRVVRGTEAATFTWRNGKLLCKSRGGTKEV